MPSLDEVRLELDKDELDYPALASELGPDVLPELHELVTEDEPRIASKAAYLAGLIAEALLADPDVGVRARAVQSAAKLEQSPLADRVRAMAADDPEPGLRDLAASLSEDAPA
jgi:hypothetical protein